MQKENERKKRYTSNHFLTGKRKIKHEDRASFSHVNSKRGHFVSAVNNTETEAYFSLS